MNPELAGYLRESMAERVQCTKWNEFRRLRPESTDLSSINMDKCTVKHGDFRRINFCGMRAERAEFSECDFSRTDMYDAQFRNTLFHRCDFQGADLSNSVFRYCQFSHCDLRGALFKGARLDWHVFRSCRLEGVDFLKTKIVKSDFRENYLVETILHIARIGDSFLSPAYSPVTCDISLPECKGVMVEEYFVKKPLRDIARRLSQLSARTIMTSKDLDKDGVTHTIGIHGVSLEKYIDMMCRAMNLEMHESVGPMNDKVCLLRPRFEKQVPVKFRDASLRAIGAFIAERFGVAVEFESRDLADARVTAEFDRISLRQLCVELCRGAHCRVLTHIEQPDGSKIATEDRNIDFNRVKQLYFYQVQVVSS